MNETIALKIIGRNFEEGSLVHLLYTGSTQVH